MVTHGNLFKIIKKFLRDYRHIVSPELKNSAYSAGTWNFLNTAKRHKALSILSQIHVSATVAEKCDCRRIRRLSPLSRRFRRQSHFSATVWTGLNAFCFSRSVSRYVIIMPHLDEQLTRNEDIRSSH